MKKGDRVFIHADQESLPDNLFNESYPDRIGYIKGPGFNFDYQIESPSGGLWDWFGFNKDEFTLLD